MMEAMQWSINAVFLAFVVWTWWNKKQTSPSKSETELKEMLAQFEARLLQWEKEVKKSQELFEEKIKSIDAICEQANRILRSGRSTQNAFPPSQEEFELKEALNQTINKNEIPTLGFLENTKKRLQKDSELDLKTLLKGQLA